MAAGTQYKIKITEAVAGSTVTDMSDRNFEVKTGGTAGSLKVTANPTGTAVSIYLDGVLKTSTSTGSYYTISSVPPGSHTVMAKRANYLDYS